MRAEVISVGTELLMGETVNTSFPYLAGQMRRLGIDVYYQVTVGDNYQRLEDSVRQALERADIVITTGGLGPTTDDITVEVIAKAVGLPLELNEEWLGFLEQLEGKYQLKMTENNKKQAYLPTGAIVLENLKGTAPGVYLEHGDKIIIALPGPPPELKGIFETGVFQKLQNKSEGWQLYSKLIRTTGIGESALETNIKDIIDAQTNPTIAIYAKTGEVSLRLAAKAPTEVDADAIFAPTLKQLQERLGKYIYGYDEETLEQVVGRLLVSQGLTLACGESCSGGLLSNRITNTPGSSRYFLGGIVAYDNQIKERLLQVDQDILVAHGAVSEATAAAMAQGVLKATGAQVAISTTGIAGPDGGTEAKPVGTVYFGLIKDGEAQPQVYRRMLFGTREEIKQRTTQAALYYLLQKLQQKSK